MSNPPARAGSLHHVELRVSDLDAIIPSWDWLLTELGYEQFQIWNGGLSWKLTDVYIMLEQSQNSGVHDRRQPGLSHLAFHAKDRHDVDRRIAEQETKCPEVWLSCRIRALIPAGEYGFVAAEAEHRESDEGVGGSESESDAGDESDLGIHRFDPAVGEPVLDRGEDRGPVVDDAALEFHERGNAAASGPADPFVEGLDRFVDREFEDDAESFLEVVGPAEGGVGLDNPGELHLLLLGQVLRVLPERVAGVLHAGGAGVVRAGRGVFGGPPPAAPGFVRAGRFAGGIPRSPAYFIEGVGGPFHNMERVRAADGVGALLGHDSSDPRGPVGGNMGDLRGSFRPERIKERAQGGLVLTRRHPDQTAAVVVDDNGQILVSALIGNLIDPDPGEAGELVVQFLGISPNPGDDRADRAPRDPHQLRDRRLGRLRGQPRDLRIEVVGVTGPVPGPRHGRDAHPVDAARHPRRVGFQLDPNRSRVQRSPPSSTVALVISGATPLAPTAPFLY